MLRRGSGRNPGGHNPGGKNGRDGEAIAAAFIESKGAVIVARNWRPGGNVRGEIDLIARHPTRWGEFWCFVEVKTRVSSEHGEPQEAVTATKQALIERVARHYLAQHQLGEASVRFDIVEVWLQDEQKPRIEWIQNAFEVRI